MGVVEPKLTSAHRWLRKHSQWKRTRNGFKYRLGFVLLVSSSHLVRLASNRYAIAAGQRIRFSNLASNCAMCPNGKIHLKWRLLSWRNIDMGQKISNLISCVTSFKPQRYHRLKGARVARWHLIDSLYSSSSWKRKQGHNVSCLVWIQARLQVAHSQVWFYSSARRWGASYSCG